MENLVDLGGMRILVTGASSGIGRACAVLAAKLGASVILTARREEALKKTLDLMPNRSRHLVCPCDLADSAQVADLVAKAGKLSGLVHAAGVCPRCLVGASDAAQEDETFKVNYGAFMALMRQYAKSCNREKTLSVVAVSSVAASAGWATGATYCGSKGALVASVRALAVELAAKGVRVNAVSPSNVRTPMFEASVTEAGGAEALKAVRNKQPLGIGEPEQVAAAVAFLLSPAAGFITGVDLPVDGGYLAQ